MDHINLAKGDVPCPENTPEPLLPTLEGTAQKQPVPHTRWVPTGASRGKPALQELLTARDDNFCYV